MKPIKPPKELAAGGKKLGTKTKELDHKPVSKKKDDVPATKKRKASTLPKINKIEDGKKKEPTEKSKTKKAPSGGKKSDETPKAAISKEDKPKAVKHKEDRPKEDKLKEDNLKAVKITKRADKTKDGRKGSKEIGETLAVKQKNAGASKVVKMGSKEIEDFAIKQKNAGASKVDGKGKRRSTVGQDKIKLPGVQPKSKPTPKAGKTKLLDVGKLKLEEKGNTKDTSLRKEKPLKQNPPTKPKVILQGPERSSKPLKPNPLPKQNKEIKLSNASKRIKGSLANNTDGGVKKQVDLDGDEDDDTFSKQLTIEITGHEDKDHTTAREAKRSDHDIEIKRESMFSGTKQSGSGHSKQTNDIIKLNHTSSNHSNGSKHDDSSGSEHSNVVSIRRSISRYRNVGMNPTGNTSRHSNTCSKLDDFTSGWHNNVDSKVVDNSISRHSNVGSKLGDYTSLSRHSNIGHNLGDPTNSRHSNIGHNLGDHTNSRHSNIGHNLGDHTISRHSNVSNKPSKNTTSSRHSKSTKLGSSSRHSNVSNKIVGYINVHSSLNCHEADVYTDSNNGQEVDYYSNNTNKDSNIHVSILASDIERHKTEQNSGNSKEELHQKRSKTEDEYKSTYDSEFEEDIATRSAQENDSESDASENGDGTQENDSESEIGEKVTKHSTQNKYMHYEEDYQSDLDNAGRNKDHKHSDNLDGNKIREGGGSPYSVVISDISEEFL